MKKIGMIVCMVLAAGLLTDCTTAGRETAEKKAEKPAEKPDVAAVKRAEEIYLSALREKDREKQKALFREARTALLAEAEKNPDPKVHLLLGYMAELGQGMQFDGILAAKHYRKAADAGLPEAKIALAEFWRRNGIYLEDAAKLIRSMPDYRSRPAALCSLGMIYYAMMEPEKGFEYLKLAYQSKTPNVRMEVMKILQEAFEQAFKNKKYDAAMKELSRMESLEPDNFLVSQLMGVVEFSRGNLAAAEKYHLKAWKSNPAFPEVYRDLARIRLRTGRKEQALDDAKVAYAISGHNREMGIFLLGICLAADHQEDALRLIDSLLVKEPSSVELHILRVEILMKTGKKTEAFKELKKLAGNPKIGNNVEFRKNYAVAASMAGDLSEAIKANEQLLEKTFDDIAGMNLAELYIVTDQYDKAIGLLARPEFKEMKGAMERCVLPYLKACALLAAGKDAEVAIRQYKAALPAFLAEKKKSGSGWDVTMFRKWLKTAALPEEVKKTIAEMTDVFAEEKSGKVPEKAASPSAVEKEKKAEDKK